MWRNILAREEMDMKCLIMTVCVMGAMGFSIGRAGGESGPPGAGLLIHEVTQTLLPSGTYNVVTYAAPRTVKVVELGLREAGLAGGPLFQKADEIRIFVSRAEMESSPKARLWFNEREGGQLWYHTGGEGSAMNHALLQGEVLVVYTRVSSRPIAWVNVLR